MQPRCDAFRRRHAVRGSQALRDFLIPDCVPARARLANRSCSVHAATPHHRTSGSLPWRPSRGRCSSSPAGGPLPPTGTVSSPAYVGTSAGCGPCSSLASASSILGCGFIGAMRVATTGRLLLSLTSNRRNATAGFPEHRVEHRAARGEPGVPNWSWIPVFHPLVMLGCVPLRLSWFCGWGNLSTVHSLGCSCGVDVGEDVFVHNLGCCPVSQ